jgi:hypothetical protein
MTNDCLETRHLIPHNSQHSFDSGSDSDEVGQGYPTSSVFDLGNYGKLHVVTLTGDHFQGLRKHCLGTSCNFSSNVFPGAHFPAEVLNILEQTGQEHGKSQITKLLNGFLVHTDNGIIRGAIYDDHLCQPSSLTPSNIRNPSTEGSVKIFAIASHPQERIRHFILKKNAEGIMDHHEISNFMPMQRVISKMMSARPLRECKPRVIYSSPNFCTLKGYNITGEKAMDLKRSYMKLLNVTNGGENMYDSVLKLPDEIANHLSLNKPNGKICLAPLQNGFMGYRKRKFDNGQSLIFLCSANDFHHDQCLPGHKSVIQIHKIDYHSKAKDANRIFVQTDPTVKNYPKCPFNTPPITPNFNVQQSLNTIEYAIRNALMKHMKCEDYPKLVMYLEAMEKLKKMNRC